MKNPKDVVKRNWKPSVEHDPVTVDIENRMHIASEIDTRPASIESLDTYEERIGDYKARGFTYIPLPGDGKYYNTEEGWLKEIDSGQYIDEDTHLMEVLRLLQEQPFLIIDNKLSSMVLIYVREEEPVLLYGDSHRRSIDTSKENVKDIDDIEMSEIESDDLAACSIGKAKSKYPSLADSIDQIVRAGTEYDENRYGIITLADVNRRGVKIMIYVVFSGLVSQLSHKIEEEYPNSESIFKHLRPDTIGRWYKTQMEGLELHVAEYMNLIGIMQVIQASNSSFVEECGFESKSAIDDLRSINEIRNSVMHANRSLIYDRRDIQDILSAINRAQEIVAEMN